MRVVVLGGAGNFGARIVRALRGDPAIDLLVAGRRFAWLEARFSNLGRFRAWDF